MTTSAAAAGEDKHAFDLQFLLAEWRAMFQRATLVNDIFAGLTVAMVALPLNLALATAAGVEPSLGIVSGIVAGVIGALFGGQRYAVTGPAAAMAVVLIEVSHNYGLEGIWFVALIAGLLQIICGLMRMGRIMRYLPLPVVVGLSNAIGILVIFNALDDFLGIKAREIAHQQFASHMLSGHSFVSEFCMDIYDLWDAAIVKGLVDFNCMAVGMATIVLAVLARRINKRVPGPLVALVFVSLAVFFLKLPVARIINLSPIPTISLMPHAVMLPPGLTNWQELRTLLVFGLTVFFLGSIESLLSASMADGMTMEKKHRADQELIGQGLANIAMPFFGGIPVTGVITRTAVNIAAGAKTRLAPIVHSVTLLVLAFTLTSYVEQIPLATLAGIVMLTGASIFEWDATRQIMRGSGREGWVLIATMVASVLVDLTAGVLTGLLLTCFIFVRQMSKVQLVSEELDVGDLAGVPSCKFVRTYMVDGPLFFGAAQRFSDNIVLAEDLKAVILHMRSVSAIDMTGVESLLAMNSHFRHSGIRLVIAEMTGQALQLFKNSGAQKEFGAENCFSDYRDAVLDVNEKLLTTSCLGCAAGALGGDKKDKAAATAPRDCKLRSALLMDNSRIAKAIKSRIDHTQRLRTGQWTAVGSQLSRLQAVKTADDIPSQLRDTPIATLLKCQNMGEIEPGITEAPAMVIGMCIDYRKSLHLPQNCAYVIRRTGANMAGSEFSVALALSTGIEYMALICHNHCVMSNPHEKRDVFAAMLTDRHGWSKDQALSFFDQHAASREIDDAIDFSLKESQRLGRLFRGLKVVPLLFMLEDNCLYLVKDWLSAGAEDEDNELEAAGKD